MMIVTLYKLHADLKPRIIRRYNTLEGAAAGMGHYAVRYGYRQRINDPGALVPWYYANPKTGNCIYLAP